MATGSKLVHVAGRVAWDADGNTIGVGDLAAQVEQSYLNVGTALAGVGATFDDVVKLTVHVVDWTPEQMPQLLDGIARASAKLGVTPAAPTSSTRVRPTPRARGAAARPGRTGRRERITPACAGSRLPDLRP